MAKRPTFTLFGNRTPLGGRLSSRATSNPPIGRNRQRSNAARHELGATRSMSSCTEETGEFEARTPTAMSRESVTLSTEQEGDHHHGILNG
jgi:hypothetical protein